MNLLDLAPVQASDWEERGDRVVLIRPKPDTRGLRAPLDWLSYLLAPRRLKLDEVGSYCWRQMDGRRTAHEIAAGLRSAFGERVEPAELRVGRFVQMLQREELVRLPGLR